MAEKGPERGNSNAAMGLAEATLETSTVKRKTVAMIQPAFFISDLPFFGFSHALVRTFFPFFPFPSFCMNSPTSALFEAHRGEHQESR
jgi:hypothetical protein